MNGKKRLSSRVIAMLLSMTMILQNIPATAYAADPEGYAKVESNELWLNQGSEEETGEITAETEAVEIEEETELRLSKWLCAMLSRSVMSDSLQPYGL